MYTGIPVHVVEKSGGVHIIVLLFLLNDLLSTFKKVRTNTDIMNCTSEYIYFSTL